MALDGGVAEAAAEVSYSSTCQRPADLVPWLLIPPTINQVTIL